MWLAHQCRIIETKGESFRLTDATKTCRTKPVTSVDEAQAAKQLLTKVLPFSTSVHSHNGWVLDGGMSLTHAFTGSVPSS